MTLATCSAVDFDGTNDWLSRAALSGVVDSKKGILSAWIRMNGGDSQLQIIQRCGGASNTGISFNRSASNLLQVIGNQAGEKLRIGTSATFLASANWIHALFSWDMSGPTKQHCYINSVSDLVVSTLVDSTIDHDGASYGIGANNAGGSKSNASLAEFYFAPDQYLDFSVLSNREKFIYTGKPVDLGINGSNPTGTAPAVFLRVAGGAAAATFATNLGTGGNFTINGTLTLSSTSPC